jgi:ribosome-associated toxin RatA of RatAB toxin-antitoxin module
VKQLHGTATATFAAPIENCFELLDAIEGYPAWYPEVVQQAEVIERDGDARPTRARAVLHVSVGPLARDFHLELEVSTSPPTVVRFARIPHHPGDHEEFEVLWKLEGTNQTVITVELHANLSVPRLLPLTGVGDSLAQGFVAAAGRALAKSSSRSR